MPGLMRRSFTKNTDNAASPAATNKKSKLITVIWMDTRKENLLITLSLFTWELLNER
jgi:hypothetical protein